MSKEMKPSMAFKKRIPPLPFPEKKIELFDPCEKEKVSISIGSCRLNSFLKAGQRDRIRAD
jgi:hypothetical protein